MDRFKKKKNGLRPIIGPIDQKFFGLKSVQTSKNIYDLNHCFQYLIQFLYNSIINYKFINKYLMPYKRFLLLKKLKNRTNLSLEVSWFLIRSLIKIIFFIRSIITYHLNHIKLLIIIILATIFKKITVSLQFQ